MKLRFHGGSRPMFLAKKLLFVSPETMKISELILGLLELWKQASYSYLWNKALS